MSDEEVPEDPEGFLQALQAFTEQLAQETPLSGLASLAAEFWRSLVGQDMPGHYAAVLVANWLVANGAANATPDE